MKKILSLLLIFTLIFSSVPANVLAQENSSVSSDASLDSSPVSSGSGTTDLPDVNVFDNLNSQDLPLSGLTNNSSSQNSAFFNLPIKIHKLSKRNFRGDEKITIVVENTAIQDIKVSLFNTDGTEVPIEIEKVSAEDPAVLRLIPPNQFKAGKYRLVVTDSNGNTTTQDFTWGVLAINTNKSIYLPNETAKLAMAVLDETGLMVCDASVELIIKNQELGIDDTLSTSNGKIVVNPDCSVKDFTGKPDYEANYQVQNAGFYDITLTAKTNKGTYSITDGFDVRDNVSFDVERVNATRLFPPVTYSSIFNITANEDFNGTITETVPDSFAILPTDDAKFADNISSSSAQTESADVIKGQIPHLSLPYESEFAISQKFGSEIRDPLVATKYSQFGLAGHDGIDFDLPERTPVLAADDGEVVRAGENGDYGTTIVIQHEWGKSYYGHLSEITVLVGQEILRGYPIGLSGSTGLSSGPHLHFGIKPNKNDFNNGYYGKIDPMPYLGLESVQSDNQNLVFSSSQNQSYGVRVLSWNVSLKKGDKIKLGYGYKVPNVSPQFYLLGPMQFTDENAEVIFQEQRQWQLAVDDTEAQFGANNTSVCGDGSCITTWTNPGNVGADDATYAQATAKFKNLAGQPMDRIQTQDMGFTAISGTIGDIVVELQGNDIQTAGGACNDFDARLLNDTGTEVGTDQSRGTGVHWGTTEATWSYTWTSADHGLTAAQIQDVDFGFYLDVEADANIFCQPRLDYITITVNYTPGAGGGPTLEQTMRHGKWFNAGAEQPFTF